MLATLLSIRGRLRSKLAAVALAGFLALGLAAAANAQGLVVSTAVIPLTGSLGDVQIAGWLHIVVQFPTDPTIPTAIHASLPAIDVFATDISGTSYLAYGAGSTSVVCQLNAPCASSMSGFTSRQVKKRAFPTDPTLPLSFNLDLTLKINPDGTLDAAPGLGDVFPSFAVVAP